MAQIVSNGEFPISSWPLPCTFAASEFFPHLYRHQATNSISHRFSYLSLAVQLSPLPMSALTKKTFCKAHELVIPMPIAQHRFAVIRC
jgi:hypothetical protein